MSMRKIAKIMSIFCTFSCIALLSPMKANASWKQERNGWIYTQGNSKVTGWKEIGNKWYYFSNSAAAKGIMQTGWNKINGNWYYMNSDGEMQTGWLQNGGYWYYLNSKGKMEHDTTVGGYRLNSSGQWVRKTTSVNNSSSSNNSSKSSNIDIDASEARALITKNDSRFFNDKISDGRYLEIEYAGAYSIYSIVNGKWAIDNEPCYEFEVIDKTNSGSEFIYCNYIVGKNTGNIYAIPNQAGLSAYKISNNKIVKTYKWQQGSKSTGWR